MAESFGAALKRYIAGGYKAPEAMRAVWHDVRIGRVARPRRGRRLPADVPGPPLRPGTPAARQFIRRLKRSPEYVPKPAEGRNPFVPLPARAAGRLARRDRAVRRLPRVGYCVRLSDGRELCHDAQGYYLVGAAQRNPLTRKETGETLRAVRASLHSARRLPSLTAPQARDPIARAAHRGWWYGHADAFAVTARRFGTKRRGGRPRGFRLYYGPDAALRQNPALTGEQHQVLNTWAQYGPRHWLRKVKGGWITELPASVGNVPVVFKTKREAMQRVDGLILLRSHEWRGVAPNPLIRGDRMTARQRQQVLAAFVHRHHAIGAGKHYPDEAAWIRDHAFHFTGTGARERLSFRRYAQPAFMAPASNPVAAVEAFDLDDRRGWEAAIRSVGGLRVGRADRADYAEVPGYLKGYRRGVAPDELAQMIADERGMAARDVERAMLRAFHGPRRRAAIQEEDYEALEREAIQAERPRGESRPRVGVGRTSFTLRPRSPFKGAISTVNPRPVSPASKLETLRRIVAHHQAMRIGAEGSVDAFTASAILGVYDRLGPENQAKYLAMPVPRMADVAWKLLGPRANPYLATIYRRGVPSPAIGLKSAAAAERFVRKHERRGGTVALHEVSPATYRTWARGRRDVARALRGNPLAVTDPAIQKFLVAWHEAGRPAFEREYKRLDYDSPAYQHVARDRRKYIALDRGDSGVYLVDKATGDVFTIKGYGVPKRRVGTLAELTDEYRRGARINPADPGRLLPAAHPIYQTRERVPQWSVPVSPAHVPRLLRRRLPHFTKAQHEAHARQHAAAATVAEQRYLALGSAALGEYGTQGPLIAGVLREHFPEPVKDELRRLAHAQSEERDVAWAHWRAAGRRTRMPFNPNPAARLTRFYDGITEIRGVKGRRFGFRPNTRFKHPFRSRPRAFGVDRAGSARLRRGDVVLRGRRPIYAQLGA